MDKDLTEIIVIADRSSSMSSKAKEARQGFNAFLKEQQEAKVGRCLLTYCQFNTNYDIVHGGIPIADMKPLDEHTYHPEGLTALLDAVGRTINEVGHRLANTPEEKRPGNVVVVILTDGEENSSKEFTLDQVKEMVKRQADVYDWTFVFLAQGIDAFLAGGSIGLDAQHRNVFVGQSSNDGQGQQASYFVASAAVLGTRSKVARGMSKSLSHQEKAAYTNALNGDDSDLKAVTTNTTDSSSS